MEAHPHPLGGALFSMEHRLPLLSPGEIEGLWPLAQIVKRTPHPRQPNSNRLQLSPKPGSTQAVGWRVPIRDNMQVKGLARPVSLAGGSGFEVELT